MKTTQEALQEISKVNGTQQECLNALAFNSAPTGTPLTPLSVKGGVIRNIDQATGDIAMTTNGWIEDEKYGYKSVFPVGSNSVKFDSSITRTGRLTLKVSTLDINARPRISIGVDGGTTSNFDVSIIKYAIPIKPSTTYKITCYVKTNNVVTNSTYFAVRQATSAGVLLGSQLNSNRLSGTNDWTPISLSFTSDSSASLLSLSMGILITGNISDAWFDVNSMTLEEVSTITNTSSVPSLYYPKATAVTSNDNIDQSQVVSASTDQLGTATISKDAQEFLPTKKNHTGLVFRRGTDTGTYTGNITVSLQSSSGGNPSGTILASVVIPNATWAAITADTDYTVLLPATLTINGSTKYWYVWESSTTDASNFTRLRVSTTNAYPNGKWKSWNGSAWIEIGSADARDAYFKTLYSKNTTNFTVRTDTEEVSVTAPTVDGWANGTVIDSADYGVTPLTLAPGVNNIYYSSNGSNLADGATDESLQCIIGGSYGSLGKGLLTRQEACNYWAGTTGLSYQDAMNTKALTTKKTIQEAVNTYLESL